MINDETPDNITNLVESTEMPVHRKYKRRPVVVLEEFHHENPDYMMIGVDEAGRGPLFGRLYTAAVVLPKQSSSSTFQYELMKDSKKFSSTKKREAVASYIQENALYWSVQYCDYDIIDKINIRQSVHMCMRNAILDVMKQHESKLSQTTNDATTLSNEFYLMIDGNDFKPLVRNDNGKFVTYSHACFEGGDNTYVNIAAASILAKVFHDKYIESMCDSYPLLDAYYDLRKNKGYGTQKHRDGISTYGISPWHRRSYGICKTSPLNNTITETSPGI